MGALVISNKRVKAEISPTSGGRLISLVVDNQELIYVDKEQLSKGSVEGGGNPILFPICSSLKDDKYKVNNKEYKMQFHGLVYDKAWNVDCQKEDSVSLSIMWDDNSLEKYPFKFKVELIYKVEECGISLVQRIYNYSENNMPFYMGYHPFFIMNDLEQSELFLKSDRYLDYDNQIWVDPKYKSNGALDIDLSNGMDDVHYDVDNECTIGLASGRKIKMNYDDMMKNVVVWRPKDADFLCVEPWMADPDAFNKGSNGIVSVNPNDSVELLFNIELE